FEMFRQSARQARSIDRLRWIIAPHAIGDEEAEELPERREPPRRRARAGAGAGERREITAQIIALGLGDIAAETSREVVEIVAISGDGEPRRAALGGEHFEECFDM